MNEVHVPGKDVGRVTLYALSTCVWCKKTKQLLNEMGVKYSYIDVDLLAGKEKEEVMEVVRKWNPSCSFPNLVINDQKCIVGFKEPEIKEALKHGK